MSIMASSHDVSAIICTRNRSDQIGRAVASVLANQYPSFELLVVDQSTDGSTREALASYGKDHRFRYLPAASVGLSAARNLGIRHTTSPILAFTDDDCVADPHWIERVAERFGTDTELQLLFGSVRAPDWYRSGLDDGFVPEYQPHQIETSARATGKTVLGMGANMSLRRSLVNQIGYFDESLGPGARLRNCDDSDFELRAIAAEQLVMGDPGPVVTHEGGVRHGPAKRAMWQNGGYGFGALLVKALKCRQWASAAALLRIMLRLSAATIRSVCTWQRPFHLRQAYYMWRGAIEGVMATVRWPVDHGERGSLYRLKPGPSG